MAAQKINRTGVDAPKKQFTKNRTPKEYLREAVLNREACHNLVSKDAKERKMQKYGLRTGKVIAHTISALRNNITNSKSSHAQQYMLKKGLRYLAKRAKPLQWWSCCNSINALALSPCGYTNFRLSSGKEQ